MSKIMRMSDRLKVTVGDVVFTIAPLNQLQKIEINECTKIGEGGKYVQDLLRQEVLMVKYGLKDLQGVKDSHGNEYKLEMNGDSLTDDCLSEIFNLQERSQLVIAIAQCYNKVPDKITDPLTGKKLKGVSLELMGAEKPSG